jgi:uncharacterized cupredoxin-like copper-binding protein
MIKQILTLILVFATVSLAQMLPPKVSTQQMAYNFGQVAQGEHVKHDFIITNVGGDLLKINNVRASCGCTAAKPEKDELAPGESTNIKVDFNSTGRKGRQTKIITVKTNDPDKPEIRFRLTGVVVEPDAQGNLINNPIMFFKETQHDFGTVREGKVVDYTFNFVNRGEVPLKIRNVKTSCGCTAALVSDNTIEPGKKGTLKVELDTKNRVGKMSRKVTIYSNDPSNPAMVLTIFADVQKGTN